MSDDERDILAVDENGRPLLWRHKDMNALGWEDEPVKLALVASNALKQRDVLYRACWDIATNGSDDRPRMTPGQVKDAAKRAVNFCQPPIGTKTQEAT